MKLWQWIWRKRQRELDRNANRVVFMGRDGVYAATDPNTWGKIGDPRYMQPGERREELLARLREQMDTALDTHAAELGAPKR